MIRLQVSAPDAEIVLDLKARTASPDTPATQAASIAYACRLGEALEREGFAAGQVQSAQILIRFDTSRPALREFRGQYFRCTVNLVDSKGRTHSASDAGACMPHDASRERRRLIPPE
jgi:hypothetical protein